MSFIVPHCISVGLTFPLYQVAITNTVPLTKIDAQEIRAVLQEYRMSNAAVSIHQPDATIEDFIDVVEGNR